MRSLTDNGVEVVGAAEIAAARGRLGFARQMSAEQWVQLARELRVKAFVSGRVRRRRRRWAATIRVRNGADGASLGATSWGGRTVGSLTAIRRSGYSRLSQSLDRASAPTGTASTSVAVAPPPDPELVATEDPETPPGMAFQTEEPPPPDPIPQSNRYDVLRLQLNLGTLYRAMDTGVTVYATQRGMSPADPASAFFDETRRYASGGIGHFELGGRVEFYPGALDEQPFPYLGAIVSFSHSIGVQSNGRDRNDGNAVAVPTDQLDFFALARFRYRFGEARREPELHIDAGWGMFNFNLGQDALERIELDTIIPSMQHGFLIVAAGIEYGLVPTYLTMGLELGARIGTNIGGATRNVWGLETGPANGFSLALNTRVEIPDVVRGFFLALNLQYFVMVTEFAGQVGCIRAGECDTFIDPWLDDRLWEVWPVAPGGSEIVGGPQGGVLDHYVRLQLAVGFALY